MYDRETASLDELLEDLYMGSETLGEIECQHASETALYGDSWPGAQIQIQESRDSLARLRDIIARRFPEALKPRQPERFLGVPAGEENDDIPF